MSVKERLLSLQVPSIKKEAITLLDSWILETVCAPLRHVSSFFVWTNMPTASFEWSSNQQAPEEEFHQDVAQFLPLEPCNSVTFWKYKYVRCFFHLETLEKIDILKLDIILKFGIHYPHYKYHFPSICFFLIKKNKTTTTVTSLHGRFLVRALF